MTAPALRIGVLDRHGLWAEGHMENPYPIAYDRATGLARIARALQLQQLWVLWPRWSRPSVDWACVPHGSAWTVQDRNGRVAWLTAAERGTWGLVDLVIPQHDQYGRATWAVAPDGATLLRALTRYRDLVGMAFRRSPGSTGTALLRELHTGAHTLDLENPAPPPPPALRPGTEMALTWLRPLTADEAGRRYLHAYDKNGMYLGTCSSLPLGIGSPTHCTRASDLPAGAEKLPGYWRICADVSLPASEPPVIPEGSLKRAQRAGEGLWVTTPTLRLLRDMNIHVASIHEAYVWTEHHRPLEPWYKRLRDARAALMTSSDPADVIALAAVKQTYTHTLGWLATAKFDRSQDGLYRPDWRHINAAAARCNVRRDIAKCLTSGFAPFAVGSDALYFASNDPDPVRACPPTLKLGTGLGQWKVKHSVPMADARPVIDEAAAAHRLTELQKWLNQQPLQSASQTHRAVHLTAHTAGVVSCPICD